MNKPRYDLPAPARAHLERGQSLHAARNLAAALHEYQQAQALAPDREPVLSALGNLAMDAKDWKSAEQIYRHLEKLFPGPHRPRLALALFNQQRHADALPILEQLADSGRLDSNCALAFAISLERCGQPDRSVKVMKEIHAGAGNEQTAVLLTSALLRLGRRSDLDEWLPRLLKQYPQNAQLLAARSEHGFLSGDYATGFDYMHHRWSISLEKPKTAQLTCPAWDGEAYDGTLLVTAEQGLGDQILSSSVFEELVRIGQKSLIDCDARLLPLFRRSFPTLAFVDRKSDDLQRADQPSSRKIEALDLGRFFRRDMQHMPERASWLQADPERVAYWRKWLHDNFPGRRAVGLSWRSTRHLLGDAKTIPLPDLAALIGHPQLACINLQYGDTRPDCEQLERTAGLRIQNAPGLDVTEDIDGLAALIAALDAVATCSNTTAHIAGALGVPTRVMLPGSRYVLWYWGHDGEKTPWYPSLRLFRGPPRRAWTALATDVAADIAALPARTTSA